VLGAGSGEILDVMGSAFASNGKKVVGAEPSYGFVYSHVESVRGDAITLPLTTDYRQDIPALIRATKMHYRDVGFVYICNPNNPTGRIVTKQEIAMSTVFRRHPRLDRRSILPFCRRFANIAVPRPRDARWSSRAPPKIASSPACDSATPALSRNIRQLTPHTVRLISAVVNGRRLAPKDTQSQTK
jgi:hypothetical protein